MPFSTNQTLSDLYYFLKPLLFAYLSCSDPRDKRVWSGTHHSIYKSICSIGDVDVLGPYEPKLRVLFARAINQIYLSVFGKRLSYRHSKFISKGYANYFDKKLKEKKYDYVIAPAASCEIAFITTRIPIIYITDGTFSSCLNYHESLSHLTRKSVDEGNFIENSAIEKSKWVIVSSDWASKSVINDYKKEKNSVITIPYGANLELLPESSDLNYTIPKTWKLLFVGVYWDNKGGEIAYNAFKQLKKKGFNISLTVVGCIPPKKFSDPEMRVVPFIDKNEVTGQQQFYDVFKEHHFLLLPTRFDCTPIVINEASAFGIPSLVANSGGVAGHLRNGENGHLMDYNDEGPGYVSKIEKLINKPEDYQQLRKKTREIYDRELNWSHWIEEFGKCL